MKQFKFITLVLTVLSFVNIKSAHIADFFWSQDSRQNADTSWPQDSRQNADSFWAHDPEQNADTSWPQNSIQNERMKEAVTDLCVEMTNAYGGLIKTGREALAGQIAIGLEKQRIEAQGKADALKWVATANQIMKSLTDGKNLTKISAAVVGGTAGVAVAYFAAKLGYNYLDALIGKPTLVRETSIKSTMEEFKNYIFKKKPVQSRFDEIILDADLNFKIKEITDILEIGIENNEGVRHILLTGPAGTGKTMFAKALATRLNLKKIIKNGKRVPVNYICCAGADFAQFEKSGEDIAQIHSIVDYAMNADGITILFVDEVDSLLMNRLDHLATQASINRTNTVLSIFDKPTHSKIVLIGATNFESKIDKAAYSRFSKKIAFKLPTGPILTKLFDQYLTKEVLSKKIILDKTFLDRKQELINSLKDLSPRTIEDLTSQMRSRVRYLRKNVLTYDIAKALIEEAQEAEARNNQK